MRSKCSLKRTAPTPRGVPAVPLLGCTAGTSISGSCGRSIQSLGPGSRMTNPYAPPERWNEHESSGRALPLQLRASIASSSLARALAITGLVWVSSDSHDYVMAAIWSLTIVSPNVFLFMACRGQSWARLCFLVGQGALMLFILMFGVVVFSTFPTRAIPILLIGALFATSFFCVEHASSKAWILNSESKDAAEA